MNPNRQFYERTEAERIALTEKIRQSGRTLMERWVALASTEAGAWDDRAALAAKWLTDQSVVTDLGCGTMNLERHLQPYQHYVPCDLVGRDQRTIICDFNARPPPNVCDSAVTCLGLLEYLHEPEKFMRELCGLYAVAVVSYCIADAPEPLEPRRAHAWVNDYNQAGIEQLFHAAGWLIVRGAPIDAIQRLWRLERRG